MLGAAAGLLAVAVCVRCVAIAPPALPELGPVRPTILHDAVVPPEGVPLVNWPTNGTFIVPVEIDGPDESFFYDVFIDYDPVTNSGNVIPPQLEEATPDTADGGIVTVMFTIATPPDPRFCHTVEFLVARSFNRNSLHTPDSLGGDIVTWFYTAGGGPGGCPEYDAGIFQGGAFPQDAGSL
jgi:hypothetical protein